jgi:hypothetical protein
VPSPAAQYAPPPQYPPPPQYAPPAPVAPPGAYAPSSKQRGSWYIGFGLGGGGGTVDLVDAGRTDLAHLVAGGSETVSFNVRVGATLTPKLLLGFDGGFVGATGSNDTSAQLNTYDVGMMYFPRERGFFLRGALGRSVLAQTTPLGDASVAGFNVVGGLGYAFWIGRTFNLTLNADAQRHWFGKANVDSARAWSAWLGFDWY